MAVVFNLDYAIGKLNLIANANCVANSAIVYTIYISDRLYRLLRFQQGEGFVERLVCCRTFQAIMFQIQQFGYYLFAFSHSISHPFHTSIPAMMYRAMVGMFALIAAIQVILRLPLSVPVVLSVQVNTRMKRQYG